MTQAFNLSQLANNLNTSGQLDATDGLTGAVPIANGGTGSTSTQYCNLASNVTGTLPVGNGGTGVTSAGASGNVLTSNGTSWVSQAPSGGGVTSLNGQTGAITNTTFGAVGSYVIGRPANASNYAVNATVAGSSLYAVGCNTGFDTENSAPTFSASVSNTFTTYSGTSAGSGTWRCLGQAIGIAGFWYTASLWVRIS